ncbi:MAG: phosphatase [Acidimicrobiia bacterium]|nr:phosphatase [Acidimicrobiia bacterium]MCL4293021.1 phosphatase [Acidimicrobiia bacterium]
MTRRPASRRPRRLEAPPEPAPRAPRRRPDPTPRQRISRDRVAGRHPRYGRDEVLGLARRVVSGHARAQLGLPAASVPPVPTSVDDVLALAERHWGLRWDGLTPLIDPDLTLAAWVTAVDRVLDVASRGGRLIFATGRPASLLPLYQQVAVLATAAGGDVLADTESPPFPPGARRTPTARRIRWFGGVAVVTDGRSLLADDAVEAARELFFHLPRPDLVVADHGFAGGAVAIDVETVALADLDALAFGLVVDDGLPVTLVPCTDTQAPAAYECLAELARRVSGGRE